MTSTAVVELNLKFSEIDENLVDLRILKGFVDFYLLTGQNKQFKQKFFFSSNTGKIASSDYLIVICPVRRLSHTRKKKCE